MLLHLQAEVETPQRQPSALSTTSEIECALPRLRMPLDDLYAIARTEQLHLDVFVPYSGRGQLQRAIIDPKSPIHLGVLERTG